MKSKSQFAQVRSLLECHRIEITRAYLEQKKTAAEICHHMAEFHDLELSETAFKAKAKEWSINSKNLKLSEAEAAILENDRRQRNGKRSAFFKDEYPVSIGSIKQHCKRNKSMCLETRSDEMSFPGGSRLVCITPPSSPLHRYILKQSIQPAIEGEFRCLGPLDDQKYQDTIFITPLVQYFVNAIDIFCHELYRDNIDTGFEVLTAAHSVSDAIVKESHPSIIPSVFFAGLTLKHRGHEGSWYLTANLFADMATAVFGKDHPRSVVFQAVTPGRYNTAELKREINKENQFEDPIFAVLQKFVNAFEQHYGANHHLTQWYQLQASAWGLPSIYQTDSYTEFVDMVSTLDREFGPAHSRTLTVMYYSAENLIRKRRFVDAERIGNELLERSSSLLAPKAIYWQSRALMLIGECQFHEGRPEESERNLSKASSLQMQYNCLLPGQALSALSYLENIANSRGEVQQVNRLRKRQDCITEEYLSQPAPSSLGTLEMTTSQHLLEF